VRVQADCDQHLDERWVVEQYRVPIIGRGTAEEVVLYFAERVLHDGYIVRELFEVKITEQERRVYQ